MSAINPAYVEASTGVRWLKDRSTGKVVGFVDDGGKQYRVMSTEDTDGVAPADAPYDLTVADVVATKAAVSGAWTAYTPTVTAAAGTITTLGARTGRYMVVGKTMFLEMDIAITTNGNGSGSIVASLPPGYSAAVFAVLTGRENAATGNMLQGVVSAGGGVTVSITKYDNSYPAADGYRLFLSGVIELS